MVVFLLENVLMSRLPVLLTVVFAFLSLAASRAAIPLKLEHFNGPTATLSTSADGVVEIRGPNSVRCIPSSVAGPGSWVLEMEYFCVGGVPTFAVLTGPAFDSKLANYLPEIGHSETWSPYAARLSPGGDPLPQGWNALRLDLPLKQGQVLQVRNVRLRPEKAGEFDLKSDGSQAADAGVLEAYLASTMDSKIAGVTVGASRIEIAGKVQGGHDSVFLGDIPMEFILGGPKRYESLIPIKPDPQGNFAISLPRKVQRDGRDYDRLTSRWQLFRASKDGHEAISHARYAEQVVSRSPDLPPLKLKSKKGLGGWHASRLSGELEDLGIAAVTVNVFAIHQLVSLKPGPDTTPFQWQGKTYYANQKALARYDQTFREAEKNGVMVSAILLITNPAKSQDPLVRLLGHPDAVKEGTYAMPNVTSRDGIEYYGAILNLITERWSKNDGVHGRVHHWIIHNEVDAGWVCTNAGNKPDGVYMDLYIRSMRLVDLIARQYDPNARPFITLTHHWAEAGNKNWYGSKRMVELLLSYCKAEGDFPWAMAYHPYPQDLRNPRTWEDHQATFDFNTKKITPKNLEVLDAYMKLPELLYQGKVRPVHLSENGFNSPDYSDQSLEDQAAGMALAWKKMAALSSIEQWQYHNWIDNRQEGGLRIGLRKFPDEPGDPQGRKPIWHLYKALGTPAEDEVAAPYLKTIGISSWDEVLYRGEIR
jgi:hypothetical protein